MRFLALGLTDRVPDAKTIWAFRKRLNKAGAIRILFDRLDDTIRNAGYIPMSGQLVDASLISAPKQRNSGDEKQDVKAGRVPRDWKKNPAKLRRKDRDAPRSWFEGKPLPCQGWTAQFGKARVRKDGKLQPDIAIPTFGYKTHTSIDKRYRLIRKWDVTDASRHDGRVLRRGLLDKTNTGASVWADSAYRSKQNERFMGEHGFTSCVHHRKPRGKPMAANIRRGNATRSKHRAPVEHVFSYQKRPMALTIRTIRCPAAVCLQTARGGIARAKVKI